MKNAASHYLAFCVGLVIGLIIAGSPNPTMTALGFVGFILVAAALVSYWILDTK